MADGNAAAPKHGYFSLNLARRKGYTLYGSYLDNNANVRVTYVVSNENDTKDLGKDAVYVGKLGYLKYKVEVGFGFYSEAKIIPDPIIRKTIRYVAERWAGSYTECLGS